MVKIDGSGSSPAPVSAPGPSQTRGSDATKSKAIHDTFGPSRTAGPFAAKPPVTASPGEGLTPAELKSANDAIGRASGSSAEPIVEWLRQHPDSAKRDAFMDHLFAFGPAAGQILDASYTHALSRKDAQVLGDALAHAWQSGAVTAEELQAAVAEGGRGAAFGAEHIGLAQVVGRAGDTGLTLTYLRRELEIFQGSREERARANAIAVALGSLPPSELSDYLEANGKTVEAVLQALDTHQRIMLGNDIAHARLLEGAVRIEPPSAETLRLFSDAVDRLGNGGHLPRACASFFAAHESAILEMWRDDSGSLTLEGQKKLSTLFARTLFSGLPFMGQETLQESLAADLARRSQALDTHGSANPPPISAQRDARLFGSLVGAIEGGFQIAVEELKERNAAVDSMVDLIFRTAAFIPKSTLPGVGGILAGQARDVAKSQLKDWVSESLHEEARDANEAIPFHVLFGEEVDSPDLRTDYDAARADAFVNRAVGLR